MNIKLKSTDTNSKMVKLFDSIQFISAKIKAADGALLLKVDKEHMALVKNQLPYESKV